ncbi:MAG: hypothetical protein M0Q42_00140 [Xanthomonadales bacterium]|nr:hypothetical protein [Xanthomonadales bacterium]
MTYTLIAVLVVLTLSHLMPDLVRWRRHQWFARWLAWLGEYSGDAWRQGWMLLLSLGLPLLALGLVMAVLAQPLHDIAWLITAVIVLFLVWGPRDFDQDIDAIASAAPAERPVLVSSLLGGPVPMTAEAAIAAAARATLRRWFGPLLWFLLLGPVGALLYRLSQLAAEDNADLLSADQRQAAAQLLAVLDWPAVHLMSLGMAIATDFDNVMRAWRGRQRVMGGFWRLDPGLLPVVSAAAVRADLEDRDELEGLDAASLGSLGGAASGAPDLGGLLRDVRSLAWRLLVVWLALIALIALVALLA